MRGVSKDKGCLIELEGRNATQPKEPRPGKLVSNPGTNSTTYLYCPLNICFFSLSLQTSFLWSHGNMAAPRLTCYLSNHIKMNQLLISSSSWEGEPDWFDLDQSPQWPIKLWTEGQAHILRMHQGDFLRARSTVCFLSNQPLFQKKAIQNLLFLLLVTSPAVGTNEVMNTTQPCTSATKVSPSVQLSSWRVCSSWVPLSPGTPVLHQAWSLPRFCWSHDQNRYQTRSFTGVLINFWLMVVVLVSSLIALPFILESAWSVS